MINLRYKINPKTDEVIIRTMPAIPLPSKLKEKPFSVGVMPAKTNLPSTIAGMNVATNKTKNTFVDFFMPLFFAKAKFVYIFE